MVQGRGWRFPNNNYGAENGLDTGDVETFKKDPHAALAREIAQNVIDAQHLEDKPSKVEFSLFEVVREDIPGIESLTDEIIKCYEYKKDSDKEGKSLKNMKDWIKKDVIKCLRISDYNTTGLIGVSTNERGKHFYNLTKGIGVSDKYGTSGGSKGIGKFASFVASTTNTVFYSTKTIENEKGYIGISKLRSVPISEEDPDLMTMGTGYYSINKKNEPILEELNLDPDFKRDDKEYGTDVYIIGFNDSEGWMNDIIGKILDSFMVAILKDGFEVKVGDVLINSDTVGSIVNDPELFITRYKLERKDIIAQYELLCEDKNIHSKDIIIGDNNKITVYVKKYNRQNEENATKRCIMVRYPYMKIKHTTGYSYLPYSALCIIHDNNLNEKLRRIENPQHTDWEIKRLNEEPEEKKITRDLMKEMEDAIKDYIREVMKQSDSISTDVEGAGEFLPYQEKSGKGIEDNEFAATNQLDDYLSASSLRRTSKKKPKIKAPEESGEEYGFDTGFGTGDDEGIILKKESDTNLEPSESQDILPKNNIGPDGDNTVFKRIPLKSIDFYKVVVDKSKGRFDIIFNSLYDEDNCELQIKMCGESSDKYPINIIAAMLDNEQCKIEKGKIVELKLNKDKRYKIKCKLDINKLFSSEVSLYANRK